MATSGVRAKLGLFNVDQIRPATDPTIRRYEYRNCGYRLRWTSLWGHEPCGCVPKWVAGAHGDVATGAL
eukprot:5229516-Pyramimonas_sp.AAC.1